MTILSQQLNIQIPSPLQRIAPQWPNAEDYQIFIKRDDLIHPIISGNKWRKLSDILTRLTEKKVTHIGSFGGGYSNHIHALAYCCYALNIGFTAFIRGNYCSNETPMLKDIAQWKTNIIYLNKIEYKQRGEPGFISHLSMRHKLNYMIPEGGSHTDCFAGMQQLLNEIDTPYDVMLTPVASGGTLAGLATSASQIKQIVGIAVLKGQSYLDALVDELIASRAVNTPFTINHHYHGGGYAKVTSELEGFCAQASQSIGIPFEPVYSGKVLFALKQMIEQRVFRQGSRLIMLHTGGLQAAR